MKKNLTPCNVPFQKLLIIDFARVFMFIYMILMVL